MMTTTSINEKLSEMYALLSKASLLSTAPSLFEFIKEIFVNTSEYSIGTMNVLDDNSVISVSIGEDTLILQDSTEEEVYDKLSSFIDTRIEELKDLISKNEVVISDEDIPSLPETEGEVLIDPKDELSNDETSEEPSNDEPVEEPSDDEEDDEPAEEEPLEETEEEESLEEPSDEEEEPSENDEPSEETAEEEPSEDDEQSEETIESPNVEPSDEDDDELDYIPSTVRNADSDLEEEPLEPSDDDPDYIPSTLRNIEEEPDEEPLEPTEKTDILTLIDDEEEASPEEDEEEASPEDEEEVSSDEEETSPEDEETLQEENEEETSVAEDGEETSMEEDEEETSSEEETSPTEDKSDLQKKLFQKAFISGKDAITAIDNGLNGPVNVPFSNPSYAQQRRSDELRKRANLSFLKR